MPTRKNENSCFLYLFKKFSVEEKIFLFSIKKEIGSQLAAILCLQSRSIHSTHSHMFIMSNSLTSIRAV